MDESILVTTDGSERATQALNYALARAEQHEAKLHALHVVDTNRTPEPVRSTTELATIQREEQGQAQLDRIEEACREREIAVETASCHGSPVEEISRYAEQVDADSIVLGFKGRQSRSNSRLMGSVTETVMNEEQRPVIVV